MISVGITGGIGSGKTSVCRFFKTLGIPVYYADERAKWLMEHDVDLKKKITDTFGSEAYINGILNRQFLAKTVFANDEQLKKLNALVHPAVGADTANWMQQQLHQPYVLYEAAILFESGSYKMLDKIITVFAPKELRLKRVIERDKVSREDVEARMNKQLPDEEKMEKSDFVIYNDGSHTLISQILNIHQELISK
jgi:dephospho-CoA kinase